MFGLVLLGCGIYGGALGYLIADSIETCKEIDKEIEENRKMAEELQKEADRLEASIAAQGVSLESMEKILSETDEELKESVRKALEAGVEPEFIIKTMEEGEKFFNE